MRFGSFVLQLFILGGVLIPSVDEVTTTQGDSDNLEDDPSSSGSGEGEYSSEESGDDLEHDVGDNVGHNLPPDIGSDGIEAATEDQRHLATLKQYDDIYVDEYDGDNDGSYVKDERSSSARSIKCLIGTCPDGTIINTTMRRAQNNEIGTVLKLYETSLKQIDSYIRTPKQWMLDLLGSINAAIANRKHEFLTEKRDLVQVLMFSGVTFSSAPSGSSGAPETQDPHDCSGKELAKLLIDLIYSIRSTRDKTAKLVSKLRKKLYHHLHTYGTWSEQNGADLYALFNLIRKSNRSIDDVAKDFEKEWNANFESRVNIINKSCRLGVTGVRIYDQIAWIWPRLVVNNDAPLDEEKMFKNFFPQEPPKIEAETQKRLQDIKRIEAAIAKDYDSNRTSAFFSD